MAQLPWTSLSRPDPNRNYVAAVTYLPIKTLWGLPYFLYYTRRVQSQLKSARGLMGYSLLAHMVAQRFWTLSVWQDEVALTEFVHKHPHNEAMSVLRRYMGGTAIVRWPLRYCQAGRKPCTVQTARKLYKDR
jgi:heme-degrading monooxygenase HmoA